MSNYSISVIIPTKDRVEEIQKCVDSILIQTYPASQIIVVDASEMHGLNDILIKKLQNHNIQLSYVRSQPGLTYQRNLGIQENTCDLVMICDDDIELDTYFLENMCKIFQNDRNQEVGGITGKMGNTKNFKFPSRIIRTIFCLPIQGKGEIKKSGAVNTFSSDLKNVCNSQFLSGCSIYRNEVFTLYYFDENLTEYAYLEDVDFSVRVSKKYKLKYNPTAIYIHHHYTAPHTRLQTRKKRRMYLINYYYIFKKNLPSKFINKICHFWSYLGLIILAIFFHRNLEYIIGTIEGVLINISGRNYLVNQLKADRQN